MRWWLDDAGPTAFLAGQARHQASFIGPAQWLLRTRDSGHHYQYGPVDPGRHGHSTQNAHRRTQRLERVCNGPSSRFCRSARAGRAPGAAGSPCVSLPACMAHRLGLAMRDTCRTQVVFKPEGLAAVDGKKSPLRPRRARAAAFCYHAAIDSPITWSRRQEAPVGPPGRRLQTFMRLFHPRVVVRWYCAATLTVLPGLVCSRQARWSCTTVPW